MKASLVQIKVKLKARVANTGYVLSLSNPYYANNDQIKYMESALADIISDGEANPDRRFTVTPKQKMKLEEWITDLKQKYLNNL